MDLHYRSLTAEVNFYFGLVFSAERRSGSRFSLAIDFPFGLGFRMIDSMDLGFWVVGEPNRTLTERTCVEGKRTEQEEE